MRDEDKKIDELYLKIVEWTSEYSTLEIANALAKGLGVITAHQDISKRKILITDLAVIILRYDELYREFVSESKMQ